MKLFDLSRLRAVFAAPCACSSCGVSCGDDAMSHPDGGAGPVCPRCWALGPSAPATPEALGLDPAELAPSGVYAMRARGSLRGEILSDYERAMAALGERA